MLRNTICEVSGDCSQNERNPVDRDCHELSIFGAVTQPLHKRGVEVGEGTGANNHLSLVSHPNVTLHHIETYHVADCEHPHSPVLESKS